MWKRERGWLERGEEEGGRAIKEEEGGGGGMRVVEEREEGGRGTEKVSMRGIAVIIGL